jgi:2-polyprenyl-6-methoxyphenol hydroxylase-like FAD-dependent oxidoreductase
METNRKVIIVGAGPAGFSSAAELVDSGYEVTVLEQDLEQDDDVGLPTSGNECKLTQSDFATQHGVGLSTLSKWLRLERNAVPARAKFQEVRLPSPASRGPIEVVTAHRAGSCGCKTVGM